MSEAAYLDGDRSVDEMEISEALSNFVSRVLATTNVMWAASNFSEVNMSEDIGLVANNLHNEAFYLRQRLDSEIDKRLEELKKLHPERFKNSED